MNNAEILELISEKEDEEECKGIDSLINLTGSIVESASIQEAMKGIIEFLVDYYKENTTCVYFICKSQNRVIHFRKLKNDLVSTEITNKKLLSRIKTIEKPLIRKRSISIRKNVETVYYPLEAMEFLDLLIELPLLDSVSESQEILENLSTISPLLLLSFKNSYSRQQLDFQVKEVEKILHTSPSGIASIDASGSFLFVNQMFEMMTGYSSKEIIGSQTVINQIFPEFSFVVLEGKVLEGKIYNIRRKDGEEFPCHVSITQVTEDEKTTLILTINDASYNIKQKEEIRNLRIAIANEDNVGVALFRFAAFGGELIEEDLRRIKIIPDVYSTLCYTSIAQGNRQSTGVFGPIPAPKLENNRTIIFTFQGKDDVPLDHRMKGKQYYMISVIFPNRKTEFLISNKAIEKKFKQVIRKHEYPNRMSREDLIMFREMLFVE
ncbi:MAG: PAS domain S-box protein [Candidatus Heimdallarchaeota archaeon]|nr:PAS domain S-box protein [Candidatus Heimdallarchaeota archaeon]MCK4955507.1 PAS domain S-box protein [Candidatus Heimdallarchaeota archaeon]